MTTPIAPAAQAYRQRFVQSTEDYYANLLKAYRERFPREETELTRRVGPRQQIGPFETPAFLPTLLLQEVYAGITGNPGEMRPGGAAYRPGEIDLTDPAVDPGDLKRTPLEGLVYRLRRAARTFGAASPSVAGVVREQEEGNLLPPKNFEEGAIDVVSSLLAGIIPWLAVGPLAGAAGAEGALATNIPRAVGRFIPGVSRLGQAAEAAGLKGGGPIALLTGRGAPLTARGVEEAIGGLVVDAAIGAGYGAGEAAMERMLGHDSDIGREARNYALFGLGLGTLFRAKTAINTARSLWRVGMGVQEGLGTSRGIAPGLVIDGVGTKLVGGKIQFYEKTTGRTLKTDAVNDEQIRKFQIASVDKAQGIVEGTQPLVEQTIAAADPQVPKTLPPDLANPQTLSEINLIAAKYYIDAASSKVHSLGPERLQSELLETRKLLFQPEFSTEVRRTAAARIMALEHAAGQSVGTPSGVLPLDLEVEALTFVRQELPRQGADRTLQQAARIAYEGRPEVGRRIEELVRKTKTGEGDLVTAYHDQVQEVLDRVSAQRRRGFKEGSLALHEDRPVELVENPKYGLAYAKTLDGTEKVVLINTENLIAWPKSGKTVRLKNGEIVKADGASVERGMFQVRSPQGERWERFDQIDEVGSARSIQKQHEFEQRLITERLPADDIRPIPPTPAVTAAGENIIATGIGAQTIEVQTVAGAKKTIKRSELKRSTKQKPAQPTPSPDAPPTRITAQEIVDFAPGSFPDEGHRVLFYPVPKSQVEAFETGIKRGEAYFADEIVASVLPTEPIDDLALYALELPADKPTPWRRTDRAKKALNALAGKGAIDSYEATVVIPPEAASGMRVYRVSDDLHRAVQRPLALTEGMSQNELTGYLRNLIAMNDEIHSELAVPTQKIRKGRKKVAESLAAGNAAEAFKGQSEVADGIIEALEAKEAIGQKVSDPIQERIVFEAAQLDPNAAERAAFNRKGLTPETEAYWSKNLDELLVSPEGDEREVVIAVSMIEPGQRMLITKRERPALTIEGKNIKPTTEAYFELLSVDGENQPLREAVKTVKTPQEVSDFLLDQGYEPTPLRLLNAEYFHPSKPSLTATIRRMPSAGVEGKPSVAALSAERRVGKEPVEAVKLSQKVHGGLAILAEASEGIASGKSEFAELARAEFATSEAAHEWLSQKGFKINPEAMQDRSLPARFRRLPSIDRLKATPLKESELSAESLAAFRGAQEEMRVAQLEVDAALSDLRAIQGMLGKAAQAGGKVVLPDVLSDPQEALALQRLASPIVHAKVEKQAELAYDDLRKAYDRLDKSRAVVERNRLPLMENELQETATELGELLSTYMQRGVIPQNVADYAANFSHTFYAKTSRGPFSREIRKAIGTPTVQDIGPKGFPVVGDLSGRELSLEQVTPAEVKLLSGFRVGSTKEGMESAIKKLREVLDTEISRYSDLGAVRAKILDELDTAAQQLNAAVEIGEFEAVRKKIVGLRKDTLRAARTVTHQMHTKPGVYINPPDFGQGGRIFYQHVLGGDVRTEVPLARSSKKIVDAHNTQSLMAESSAKLDDVLPSPSRFDPKNLDLARYTKTGQIVQIIGGPLEKLTGPELTVRFVGTGEEMTVARELIQKGKSAGQDQFDAALTHWVVEGKFADNVPSRPRFGYGPLEQRLGLTGTNSRAAVTQALQKRADEFASTIKINKDGTFSARSKESIDALMNDYRDALWLDLVEKVEPVEVEVAGLVQPKFVEGVTTRTTPVGEASLVALKKGKPQTVTRAGKFVGLKVAEEDKISNAILGAINRVTGNDGKALKAFKRAAYDRMRQTLGDHPFAELQARAFSGYLEPHQEAILRGWMDEIGLGKNIPLARAAVELQRRQLLDPHSARIAVQLNKEMGYELRLGSILGGIPQFKSKLIFKPVSHPGDLHFGGLLAIPWKVAARHPLTRLAMDHLYRARDQELRSVQGVRVLVQELQRNGIMKQDRNLIRSIVFEARENELHGWEDIVAKAPSLRGKTANELSQLQTGWRLTREFLEDNRYRLIRHFLRRRVQPIEFTADDLAKGAVNSKKALLNEVRLDPTKIGQGAVAYHSHPDLAVGDRTFMTEGAVASGWTEDQIDVFIGMLREPKYRSSIELPPTPPPGVKEDIYEEMKDVYDFWQRYGIDNYWPLIHEGNLAIIVNRGNQEVVMGWAGTFVDAVDAARHLRKTGKVGAHEGMSIVENATVADDIMIKAAPTNREFQALQRFYAEQVNLGPDEVNILIERVQKPLPPYMTKPGNVHAKKRVAELAPIFEDFDKEIALYNARLARMEYRWNVRQAWQTLHDYTLDKALSESYGTPRLHGGKDALPLLYKYMQDRFSLAIGERGSWERFADSLWMFINMAQEAPKDFARVLSGELDYQTVINPSTYYKKYAARARANDLLKVQSLIRLGLSPATAIANFTQRWVSTFPKLIDERTSPDVAAKLMWDAQSDGRKIWRAYNKGTRPTGELGALYQIIDDAGIDLAVMKQLAGGGRSFGDTFGKPLNMGQTRGERIADWGEYWAMHMFNGSEKVNRYSTAIAAVKKYARSKGKTVEALTSFERAEAGEAARDLVRTTQFLYDELSMPRALSWFGPIGRILFQFKPFMINMFGFQKDLLMNLVMKRDKVAIEQMGTHLGALFALGGATGLLYSPFVSLPAEIFRLAGVDFIDPGTRLQSKLRQRRKEMATPEENFTETQVFRADDVLFYGLPGLAALVPGLSGISLGERIGISGQDIMLSADAPGFLGPHASVYLDLMAAWNEYLQAEGRGPGAAGALAGNLALSFVPKQLRDRLPYAASVSGLLGAAVATKFAGREMADFTPGSRLPLPDALGGGSLPTPFDLRDPFQGFLTESASGRRYLSRIMPTALRNSGRTLDLFLGGAMLDLDGKPMHVPVGQRLEEASLALMGLPSIRREEYQAAAQFTLAEDAEMSTSRASYIDRIARAFVRGTDKDIEIAYDTYDEALKQGIDITQEMVEREIQNLAQERMESIRARVSPSVR